MPRAYRTTLPGLPYVDVSRVGDAMQAAGARLSRHPDLARIRWAGEPRPGFVVRGPDSVELGALVLTVTPAAAGSADYGTAYRKARTYAQAHMEQDRQLSCRRAIGRRGADLLLDACDRVLGGSTSNYCTPANTCGQILDRLDWCQEWRDGVPCVPNSDGGQDRAGRDISDW